jgi:poly-gamma-glutamate capsule biosynthesis protein CapA/YwtB (metallophosphatase superfamily)
VPRLSVGRWEHALRRGMAAPVELAFVGDLMLGRGVSRRLRDHPPDWFWGDVRPTLQQADAVIANLESPITDSHDRWRRSWKMFHFRADPAAIHILERGNIRFVCLANNHILDFSEIGLVDTLNALDAANIRHAGAGRSSTEAAAPAMLELPGLRVGLAAATDNMRAFAAGPQQPGTHFVNLTDDADGLDWVDDAVQNLRQGGADLIVLSLHWGPNMRRSPSRHFRRFAHAAIERGVDVIHGHSAHVVQAVERHAHGVILYDTGNFIDDYWKFPFRRTITSFVFLLDIEDGRPVQLRLIPVHIHSEPLRLASGTSFRTITGRMTSLCDAFDTPVVNVPEGLVVPLS